MYSCIFIFMENGSNHTSCCRLTQGTTTNLWFKQMNKIDTNSTLEYKFISLLDSKSLKRQALILKLVPDLKTQDIMLMLGPQCCIEYWIIFVFLVSASYYKTRFYYECNCCLNVSLINQSKKNKSKTPQWPNDNNIMYIYKVIVPFTWTCWGDSYSSTQKQTNKMLVSPALASVTAVKHIMQYPIL